MAQVTVKRRTPTLDPIESVTLVLSPREAKLVATIIGSISSPGLGTNFRLYEAIDGAGVQKCDKLYKHCLRRLTLPDNYESMLDEG